LYRAFDSAQRIGTFASRLQSELSRAIEGAELFVLYQPLFSLEDRSLIGVEALVRWRHPEREVVAPDDFIPFAEQHGLIGRIDSFVLNEAFRQLAAGTSREDWLSGFTMAVNVSGRRTVGPRVRRACCRGDRPQWHPSGAALPGDDRERARRRVGRRPRDTVSPVEGRREPPPRRPRATVLHPC